MTNKRNRSSTPDKDEHYSTFNNDDDFPHQQPPSFIRRFFHPLPEDLHYSLPFHADSVPFHADNQDHLHIDLELSLSISPPPPPSAAAATTPSLSPAVSQTYPLELSPSHPIHVPPSSSSSGELMQEPIQNPNPTVVQIWSSSKRQRTETESKSKTVPVPFPWATDRRARILPMHEILAKGIQTISGEVQCKKCNNVKTLEFDLKTKCIELFRFIAINRDDMKDRAPENRWTNPTLPTCNKCGEENCCKPVIPKRKRDINWLFLLLGEFLGCCTLDHLKYFCKHTYQHRTGAKNRVLFLTYLGLCKQLDPTGPFDYP